MYLQLLLVVSCLIAYSSQVLTITTTPCAFTLGSILSHLRPTPNKTKVEEENKQNPLRKKTHKQPTL